MKPFQPYPYAYIRGSITPIDEAKVSIMTNALQYGIAVYGGVKGFPTDKGLQIFKLDEHVDRLKRSCEFLKFRYDFDEQAIKQIFVQLVRCNKPTGVTYFRPFIYRSDTKISPDIAGEYDFALYMLDMPAYFDNTKGTSVCISSWVRNHQKMIPPHTKASGGYINSALAIDEAHQRGYDSAVMLDIDGNISEGAVMNLFIVKDSKLITPSDDSDILLGITRATVLDLAKELGLSAEQRKVSKEELFTADEVFFTGTAANVSWCRQVEDKTFGDRPGIITQRIMDAFEALPQTHPEYYTEIRH